MNERLAALLNAIPIKQAAFAEQIGVAPSTVSQWLNGKRIPSEAIIRHICQTFHVNQNWLETGDGEMFSVTDADEKKAIERMVDERPLARSIVKSLSKLTDREWETVEKIITSIKTE